MAKYYFAFLTIFTVDPIKTQYFKKSYHKRINEKSQVTKKVTKQSQFVQH